MNKKNNNDAMSLLELQKILGDRIRVALDESKSMDEREKDNNESNMVLGIAKQMINNGNLILNIEKTAIKAGQLENGMAAYSMING